MKTTELWIVVSTLKNCTYSLYVRSIKIQGKYVNQRTNEIVNFNENERYTEIDFTRFFIYLFCRK